MSCVNHFCYRRPPGTFRTFWWVSYFRKKNKSSGAASADPLVGR